MSVYGLLLLPLLFLGLPSACSWHHRGPKELNQFTQHLGQLLFTADQIKVLNPEYASGEEINRPPRATVVLLQFRTFATTKIQSACLLYQIPLPRQTLDGVLKVVDESCDILAAPLRPQLTLSSVQKLRLHFLESASEGLERFAQLRLRFTYQGQEQELDIPLWNVKKPLEAQLFRSSGQVAHGSPLLVLGSPSDQVLLPPPPIKATDKSPLLGSSDASYLQQDYVQCREVDERCRVIKDQCHLCRYGHFPVASNQKFCPGNWDRFCGPNRCGEQGQMACVRGKQQQSLGNDPSAMGICADTLQGYFDEAGILVCL